MNEDLVHFGKLMYYLNKSSQEIVTCREGDIYQLKMHKNVWHEELFLVDGDLYRSKKEKARKDN